MEGQISVPDDFDTMGAEEIDLMFYGEALSDKKAAPPPPAPVAAPAITADQLNNSKSN